MTTWTIYTTSDGAFAVSSPYSAQLVAECKRRMGKYTDLTVIQKDGSKAIVKAWKLNATHKPAIQALCSELFPSADQLITRIVTWTAGEYGSLHAPTADGYRMIWFGRDSYNISQSKDNEPFEILEVVTDTLRTGGSRNNPRLYGAVTLKLRCRSQAIMEGDGWTVEVLE